MRDVIIEDSKIAMIYEYHGIPLNHLLDKAKAYLTIDQIKVSTLYITDMIIKMFLHRYNIDFSKLN